MQHSILHGSSSTILKAIITKTIRIWVIIDNKDPRGKKPAIQSACPVQNEYNYRQNDRLNLQQQNNVTYKELKIEDCR